MNAQETRKMAKQKDQPAENRKDQLIENGTKMYKLEKTIKGRIVLMIKDIFAQTKRIWKLVYFHFMFLINTEICNTVFVDVG